ncbi:MAG TPA: hypothetical protein PLX09_09780 [Xanthomonadaceae bacterium]|nr:hypothetical protein [Xanthomonadaceae bacterium]
MSRTSIVIVAFAVLVSAQNPHASPAFDMLSQPANPDGVVCLGKNLSKLLDEHGERLQLQVDDRQSFAFNNSFDPPREVVNDLRLDATHVFKVFFDGELVRSWQFDFRSQESHAVHVWRSPGAWRMEPIAPEACAKAK